MEKFDIESLAQVVVLTGHYGVGKTNLAINLALDARRCGIDVVLADLDVVNPYFRTSDYRELLEEAGVRVITTAFAGTTLDNPGVTGRVATACEWAYEYEVQSCTSLNVPDGSVDSCSPDSVNPRRLFVIDAGGDDAGATALGRFAPSIVAGHYDMLHVLNRSRNLTHRPEQAIEILHDVERASRLRVTALANNTHLSSQTDRDILSRGVVFARDVANLADIPLAFTTVPRYLENNAGELGVIYPVDVYVKKPWE